MATVDGYTTAKLDELLGNMIVDVTVDDNGQLIYTKQNGSEINGGPIVSPLEAVKAAYPVGSIYTNVVPTNPSDETMLGFGTWVRFGQGRVLVGQDSTDTDFDTAQETGGEKKHQLTVAELATHNHDIAHDHGSFSTGSGGAHIHAYARATAAGSSLSISAGQGSAPDSTAAMNTDGAHSHTVDVPPLPATNSGDKGSGTPHNNLQPYIVVYIWKRTV